MLICDQEKIREEFKIALYEVAKQIQNAQNVTVQPLHFVLAILTDNFAEISNYPCKQYFELFCDLIDEHFSLVSLDSNSSLRSAFDAQRILVLIIDKIKHFNKLSAEQSASLQGDESGQTQKQKQEMENIYVGLIQLAEKIIDNFDIAITEQILQQSNLIEEIFAKFLFQSVF